MSGSVVAAVAGIAPTDLTSLRVFRYAIGSTLAMAIAMGLNWQLSFLAPVLALSFLGTPTPRPTLREGIGFVATIAIACLAGVVLARYLLPYMMVYLPFAALVLFRLFYAKDSGIPPLLVTWMMIAILVIPLIATQGTGIAGMVAIGIVFGSAMTTGIVWLTYGVFPDPRGLHMESVTAAASAAKAPTAEARVRNAVLSTAVVFPMFVAFYMFEWIGGLLVLVFVALLSMQPAFAKSFRAGGAMILGNVIGGAAAILVYELLVMVPKFGFLLLLTLLAGLAFGSRVFSGKKTAPLYGMAFSTVVLIIGSTTSSTGDAGAEVYVRVLQILVAVVYVVVAFGVADRFLPRRKR